MSPITKICFRADASENIGSGHVQRCLTLANALKYADVQAYFLCRQVSMVQKSLIQSGGHKLIDLSSELVNPSSDEDAKECLERIGHLDLDWLVLDHYAFDFRWERLLRNAVGRLMIIDDLANRVHDADLLLDQNLVADFFTRYDGLINDNCGRLLGPRYAILHPDYERCLSTQSEVRIDVNARDPSVVIYFGGADNFDLTTKSLAAALTVLPNCKLTIVLPQTNKQWPHVQGLLTTNTKASLISHVDSLAEIFANCDLAIGACGTTTWERLCMGVPSIVITLADNQLAIAHELHQRGLIDWVGRHTDVATQEITAAIKRFLNNPDLATVRPKCRSIVDGKGTQRIVAAITAHKETSLVSRLVQWSDANLLLEWANDPVTRKVGFSSARIDESTHERWLSGKLASTGCKFFVVETLASTPIGQVRFEKCEQAWEVHYSLASAFRGKGLGRPMLQNALTTFLDSTNANVFGRVKNTNTKSCAIFEQLGFEKTSTEDGICIYTLAVQNESR